MHISFKMADQRPLAVSESSETHLTFHDDPAFYNRSFRFYKDAFLFDGYTHWFCEDLPLKEEKDASVSGTAGSLRALIHKKECFTITIAFMPLTYSGHSDGLLSCTDRQEGLSINLNAGGIISATIGNMTFTSKEAHIKRCASNVITLVYHGDAGWCHLYVNGVLSSGKQFRRHTPLSLPDVPLYLGRRLPEGPAGRQHDPKALEQLPFGCFYGYMRFLDVLPYAEKEDAILKLHQNEYTGIYSQEAEAFGMPNRSDYLTDRNRPVYHLIPPGKWMNEPHAPMFYRDRYHIFYQANPHAPIWDHLSWGHLESPDMIHWTSLPLALIPENEPASPEGCWSGSAVITKDRTPRLYFTAGNEHHFPNQSVAFAVPASSDPQCIRWTSSDEPVQRQNAGWMGEFRDPFVWCEEDTYFMLVGSGDPENGGGNAILYSSEDGLQWEKHGFIADYDFNENAEVGHVWELPVMLPLRDENGSVVCHILLFCACQIENDIVETYYFLGNWDPKAGKFTIKNKKAGLIDLGKGAFTGPSGFVTPDLRSVVFTIAQGKRTFFDELHAGWAHNGGMPLALSMRKGRLAMHPIREVDTLQKEVLYQTELPEEQTLPDGELYGDRFFNEKLINEQLSAITDDTAYLSVDAEGDRASVILHYGSHHLEVTYDKSEKRLQIFRDADHTPLERFRGSVDLVDIGEEAIHFSCYLDHSMLEIYLNDRKAVTLRNYTEGQRYFQVKGNISRLKLVHMDTAYPM